MIEQLLEQAKHQWFNIGAVVFLLIIIPVRSWIRNRTLEKLKKRFYKDEYILVVPVIPFIVEYFAPFLLGGSTLELILSHDDPPGIFRVRLLVIFILSFCVFLSFLTIYVITDKRIFRVPSFELVYKFKKILTFKFFELNISDIASLTNKKGRMGYNYLEIGTKTGQESIQLMFDNMNDVQVKINSQILLLNNA